MGSEMCIRDSLPNVIPAVAAGIGYTAVAGTLCTSIKDRFLERQVLPAWSKDTRARNFAVKRGTGIGIWILCILICLETLRIEAGVSVKSIIGLTSIFGIATGFAVKDLASNWVGGLLLFVTRPFVPGDKIEMTRLKQSVVERIGWYGPVWKYILRRVHAIDATPARWRGDAGSSPLDGASTAACTRRTCLLYTSPSPRDLSTSRMPSSA